MAFPLKSDAVKIADAMWDHGCGFPANLSAEGVFWGNCFSWNSSFEWEWLGSTKVEHPQGKGFITPVITSPARWGYPKNKSREALQPNGSFGVPGLQASVPVCTASKKRRTTYRTYKLRDWNRSGIVCTLYPYNPQIHLSLLLYSNDLKCAQWRCVIWTPQVQNRGGLLPNDLPVWLVCCQLELPLALWHCMWPVGKPFVPDLKWSALLSRTDEILAGLDMGWWSLQNGCRGGNI